MSHEGTKDSTTVLAHAGDLLPDLEAVYKDIHSQKTSIVTLNFASGSYPNFRR